MAEPASPAERPYHHGDLRRALLDAARELIVERGVPGTSLRQIARRAGVSVRAPYHHFPDKLSLLAQVAREGFARLEAAMATHAGVEDPVARITELGITYVEFAQQNPGDFQAMYWDEVCDPGNFPDRQEVAAGPFRYLLDALEQLARHPLEKGELLRVAVTAWATVHGLATLRAQGALEMKLPAFDPDELTRDVVRRSARALVAELAGPGSRS